MADDDKEPAAWKLLAEVIRLWLPILLSACAITLTLVQSMATRRHARLSVQPHVEWRLEQDDRAGMLKVSLVNVGLGPAILKTVSIMVDGQPRQLTDLRICADISEQIGRADSAFDTYCFVQRSDRVIPAGDTLELYRTQPAPDHEAAPPMTQPPDYRRFAVAGSYCSFYEDRWKIETP